MIQRNPGYQQAPSGDEGDLKIELVNLKNRNHTNDHNTKIEPSSKYDAIADLEEIMDYAFNLCNQLQINQNESKLREAIATLNINKDTPQTLFQSVGTTKRDFKMKLSTILHCESDESTMNALSDLYENLENYRKYHLIQRKLNENQNSQVNSIPDYVLSHLQLNTRYFRTVQCYAPVIVVTISHLQWM